MSQSPVAAPVAPTTAAGRSWWWGVVGASAVSLTTLAALSFITSQQASKRSSKGKTVPRPWLGFLPVVGESPEFFLTPMRYMWRRALRYKSRVFKGHFLSSEVFVVSDMDWARSALPNNTVSTMFIPVSTYNTLLGEQNHGPAHPIFRKNMTANLSPPSVRAAMPQIVDIMHQHLTKRWPEACAKHPKGVLQLDYHVRALFMELALGPLVCCSCEGIVDVEELTTMAMDVQGGLFSAPIYLPGTSWYKAINTRDKYFSVLAKMIAGRFPPAYPGGPLRLSADTWDHAARPGIDLTRATLQVLEETGQELNMDVATGRMAGSILGATETTGASTFALIAITASLQEVQEKIRQEQAALVKSSGAAITWEDLMNRMPYTDAVVRETLRVVPPVVVTYRRLLQDVELDGHVLPKDGLVAVSVGLSAAQDALQAAEKRGCTDPHVLGLDGRVPKDVDPDIWEEAFQPERWLERDGAGDSAYPRALRTFGFAHHSCLGRDLAIAEMKLVLATLARHFRWSLPGCPKPKWKFLPHLRLANGKPELRLTPDPLV